MIVRMKQKSQCIFSQVFNGSHFQTCKYFVVFVSSVIFRSKLCCVVLLLPSKNYFSVYRSIWEFMTICWNFPLKRSLFSSSVILFSFHPAAKVDGCMYGRFHKFYIEWKTWTVWLSLQTLSCSLFSFSSTFFFRFNP